MLDAFTLMSETTTVLAAIGVDIGVIVLVGVIVGIVVIVVIFGNAGVIVVSVVSDVVNNLAVVIVTCADDKGLPEVADVTGGSCLGVDLVIP